jgi:hypothetical protein
MIPVFPSQTNDPRLLDFEKYLAGNELQVGGFDLLYKALKKNTNMKNPWDCACCQEDRVG